MPDSSRTPARHRRRASPAPVVALALAVLSLATAACQSPLARIDRQTQQLLRDTTDRLGPEAGVPAYRAANIVDEGGRTVYAEDPDTTNPAASELEFSPLDAEAAALTLGQMTAEEEAAQYNLRLASDIDPTGADVIAIDLPEALRLSQRSAREFLSAEEDYVFAAIRLLIERHRWGPRLFNDTSVGLDYAQDDGSYTDSAVRVVNELRLTQRLPYGGDVAARWVWSAAEDLRSSVSGQYVQSSSLILDANIPLLRGAGMVAREDLIQSERSLVYAARDFERFRRTLLVSIAADYFDLVQSRSNIDNTRRALESFQTQLERDQARLEAGRINAFDVAITEGNVLQRQRDLNSAIDGYLLQVDQFKVRLGLNVSQKVRIEPFDFELPSPDTEPLDAIQAALLYRLDLQTERDEVDDRRRALRIARNQLLPSLDLDGALTLRTDADEDEGGLVYEPDDAGYSVGVTFGLPLDREIERLQLRQSMISLQRAERSLDETRDNIVLNVRNQLRNVARERTNLMLAERDVEIQLRRQEEQDIRADEVTPQQRVDTEDALIRARTDRDQALTRLRNAILNYLLSTGQLRVDREGQLEPLPGMTIGGGAGDDAGDGASPPDPDQPGDADDTGGG